MLPLRKIFKLIINGYHKMKIKLKINKSNFKEIKDIKRVINKGLFVYFVL